jgi:hypothetical protein
MDPLKVLDTLRRLIYLHRVDGAAPRQGATMYETDCPEPYENDLEEYGRREVDEDAAAGEYDDQEVDPEVLDATDLDQEFEPAE